MAAVPFDTLKLARRLEGAGFPPKQAGDTAEALAEAMSGADLATTADLDRLGTDLRAEIAALRAELKAEIAAVRAELKTEIAAVRAEVGLLRRDLTIRLGGMIVVAVGVILAAMRYLPPPHP
jgi:uncharacterized protein involved in exopolysaccharide biosynthesis